MIPKENLVLVNAFLTNSLVLKGLIDYLGHYFVVHFIDLPGFTKDVPPLAEITLENYARYVRRKIEALDLDRYLLGGISFGFSIISHLTPDERCQGLVAVAPYLNSQGLKLGRVKKSTYSFLVRLTTAFDLSARIWEHRLFQRVFRWYSDYPPDRVETILSHMEGRTFFETARIILRHRDPCRFHPLPHVLILSYEDKTIDNDPLLRLFEQNVKRLKVVHTEIDHYPLDTTEAYFRARFPEEDIREIIGFFNGKSRAS
jgi:pimeloyl-ACP methyl ester carboxylesterase